MTPAMMLILVPALMWPAVTRAPQSMIAVASSLSPPSTPFLMLLRLALEERPPVWQVGLSVVLTVAATVLIVYAAEKIVRTGLLMQGKGITLGELVRRVRA